jgi:hypothetical protein
MSGADRFFAIDRRAWAVVCSISLPAAVAYLVAARHRRGEASGFGECAANPPLIRLSAHRQLDQLVCFRGDSFAERRAPPAATRRNTEGC